MTFSNILKRNSIHPSIQLYLFEGRGGSWTQYQLTLGGRWCIAGTNNPSYSQFNVFNNPNPNLHAGAPEENPHRHRENMQTQHLMEKLVYKI